MQLEPNPNQKHMIKYCTALLKGGTAKVEAHVQLIKDFNERVTRLDLGYDLQKWCADPSYYK